jgi:hypothetical protein
MLAWKQPVETCSFLTISLVEPSATRRELQPQSGNDGYVPGPMATSYRREHVLYHELSGLRPGLTATTMSDPALVDVARGMKDMVAEARTDRNDRMNHREEDRRSRTVRENLGDTITDRLLLLCQATNDDNLPRLYYEWAACTWGVSKRYVFQQAVGASCAVLNVPVFDVTHIQVMTFKNFRLAGSSYFDIGSRLLPFSITHADATSPAARAMLVADRVHADVFDVGANPES